jgi:hypothetical protein
MRITEQYRIQHAQISEMIYAIEARLDVAEVTADPTLMRRLFTQLAGKLLFHLALEDGAFYPRLLVHPEREVRQLANHCVAEGGHLRAKFEDFMRRWIHSELMRRDPETFVREAEAIFRALQHRIELEDEGLYELVDRIESRNTAMLLGIAV